jgi:F-type H+-transporting ATPase subunit delta
MASQKVNKHLVARRYAQALFDLATESKKIDNVAADLNTLKTAITESEELAMVIKSPTVSAGDLGNAIEAILTAIKAQDVTKQFCLVANSNGRLGLIPEISDAFNGLVSTSKGEVTAVVTSAKALKKAEAKKIGDSLSKSTGKKVQLEENVDESLLGGMTITIGSHMLDSSLSGRLEHLELYLKNAS